MAAYGLCSCCQYDGTLRWLEVLLSGRSGRLRTLRFGVCGSCAAALLQEPMILEAVGEMMWEPDQGGIFRIVS